VFFLNIVKEKMRQQLKYYNNILDRLDKNTPFVVKEIL